MPFPTMSDSNCHIRKALNQFKWADVSGILGEQSPVSGSERAVKDAVTAAKAGSLSQAYVKVGLVNRHLVFRIKHQGGHWGDDDIVVVRNYTAPPSENGTAKVFKKSSVKPVVSLGWWRDTKQAYADGPQLAKALTDWEGIQRILQAGPKAAYYQGAVDKYLAAVETAAQKVQRAVGHADDKTIMQRFIHEVSEVAEAMTAAGRTYGTKVATQVVTEAESRVQRLAQKAAQASTTIKTGRLDQGKRAVVEALQSFSTGSPTTDRALQQMVTVVARTEKVDDEDLLAAVKAKPEVARIGRKFDEARAYLVEVGPLLARREQFLGGLTLEGMLTTPALFTVLQQVAAQQFATDTLNAYLLFRQNKIQEMVTRYGPTASDAMRDDYNLGREVNTVFKRKYVDNAVVPASELTEAMSRATGGFSQMMTGLFNSVQNNETYSRPLLQVQVPIREYAA